LNAPGSSAGTKVGGGGGGSANGSFPGASGGSGIVIVSYSNTAGDATTVTGTYSFTNSGGNKIYRFTSSGSIRWGA
jgi:hypothetical protein